MTSTTSPPSTSAAVPAPAGPATLPQRVLVQARACPRCEAPAMPGAEIQVCVHCKKPFLLVAGPKLDDTRVACTTGEKPVKVTYGDAVMRYSAVVDDSGITVAELDPVTGRIAVGKRTVAWSDIATIGLYRRVDWVLLILDVLLMGPTSLALLLGCISVPGLLVLALPATAIFALGLRKAIGIGVQRMRITPGSGPPMVFRFDSPMWKRKRFLAGVVQRCGLGDVGWKT